MKTKNNRLSALMCGALLLLAMVPMLASANEGQIKGGYADIESSGPSFVHLTAVAGSSIMTFTGGHNEAKYEPGFSGGALLDLGSGFFQFQSGVIFTQEGSQKDDFRTSGYDQNGLYYTNENFSTQHTLYYVGVPLLAKLNFMRDPDATIYIKAGVMPQAVVYKQQGPDLKNSFYKRKTEDIGDMDVKAIAALGGAIPTADNQSVIIDAGYMRGLIPFGRDSQVYNHGFIVNVGYSFGL